MVITLLSCSHIQRLLSTVGVFAQLQRNSMRVSIFLFCTDSGKQVEFKGFFDTN